MHHTEFCMVHFLNICEKLEMRSELQTACPIFHKWKWYTCTGGTILEMVPIFVILLYLQCCLVSVYCYFGGEPAPCQWNGRGEPLIGKKQHRTRAVGLNCEDFTAEQKATSPSRIRRRTMYVNHYSWGLG